MVSFIIDCWDDKVSGKALEFKDCLLIISYKCILTPELMQYYSEGQDLEEVKPGRNYFFRTSDDFQRGLIIGKITSRFQNVVIYSSRPEIIRKYIDRSSGIEEWNTGPTGSEHFTLQGPEAPPINPFQLPLDNKIQESVGANKNLNIPKRPELPLNAGFVEPISMSKSGPVKQEVLKPQSSSKFIVEKPNPILERRGEVKRNNEDPIMNYEKKQILIEKRPYDNEIARGQSSPDRRGGNYKGPILASSAFVEPPKPISQNLNGISEKYNEFANQHLGGIVSYVLDSKEFASVKTLWGLYCIIRVKITDLCKENQILQENEELRSHLEKLAQKFILDLGFFSIPFNRSINEIVDSADYRTQLIYNTP